MPEESVMISINKCDVKETAKSVDALKHNQFCDEEVLVGWLKSVVLPISQTDKMDKWKHQK